MKKLMLNNPAYEYLEKGFTEWLADKGIELAHPHNAPASKGNSYREAKVKNHADHEVETRIHRQNGRY